MKKILTMFLCVILVLSLSCFAFAADNAGDNIVIGDNSIFLPMYGTHYGNKYVYFTAEVTGTYTFTCTDDSESEVWGPVKIGFLGSNGYYDYIEYGQSYVLQLEEGDNVEIRFYSPFYGVKDHNITFTLELSNVAGDYDPYKPTLEAVLGENNIEVPMDQATDGIPCAFTAEMSGYYRIECTDENGYIYVGDEGDSLEEVGAKSVFELKSGMYQKLYIATMDCSADNISFTITYLGDVDKELEVGDNGILVTKERAIYGMECTFTAPVEGVYLFTLNDENGRVYVHNGWLVNGQATEFVLVAGQTVDVDVVTLDEECDNILLNITLKDDVVEHHYEAEVTPATCMLRGYTTYKCSDCGHEYVDDYVDALGHTPGETVIENEVAASCGTAGSYQNVVYCTVCEDPISRETVEVPATGVHNFATEAERKEATCTEDGYVIMACGCGETETTAIVAQGHAGGGAVKEKETANSCVVDGSYDMVVYCSKCSEELSRETTIIPAAGHKPGEAVKENEKAATCAVDGSYDQVTYCQVCKEVVEHKRVTVSATGAHVYANEVERKEASCTEDGYVVMACGCGESKTETVAKLGHTASEAVKENEKAATCTANGSYDLVVYCQTCKAEVSRESKVVKATGHKAAEAVKENEKAATCTADGSYDLVVYCQTCKAEVSRESKVVKATGHKAAEAVKENEKAATCTADGSYDLVVYCQTCKAEVSRESKVVKAAGHKAAEAVKENVINATCADNGAYDLVVYCATCNEELSREQKTVIATGEHVYANEVERVAPTCTEEGYVILACGCGETETTSLVATGHVAGEAVKENEVAPTCTVSGSYEMAVYCSVCKAEMSRESFDVAATGEHVFSTETGRKEASCTEAGYVTMACGCGQTQTTELPRLEHVAGEAMKENEVAATCTAAGSYDNVVRCRNCQAELSKETVTVEMTGHSYGEWATTKEPTATENGVKTRSCSACGAEETEEIPATGEQPTDPTEPQPTEPKPTEPKPTEGEETKPGTQPTQGGDKTEPNEGGNSGVIIAVIIAVVVIGGVVVVLVMKKKK